MPGAWLVGTDNLSVPPMTVSPRLPDVPDVEKVRPELRPPVVAIGVVFTPLRGRTTAPGVAGVSVV